ncbi:MAG: LytTR family transcriptional regulator DNA-binding domain-containing protein [Oscillospiraceae bacterium]|nr:LytTR family transcriptional regulator DNA-binding domain-containing protein [Oscillospiraceae bacterium]
MKIIIEEQIDGEEDQLIVKCRYLSAELLELLTKLKAEDSTLIAYIGSEIHIVKSKDIYYIETVDNTTFLYGTDIVYESKQKLYELEAELAVLDFQRIAKSLIVNLSKITSILPTMSGRLEAVLSNGERVIISRQYVSALKKRLGIV